MKISMAKPNLNSPKHTACYVMPFAPTEAHPSLAASMENLFKLVRGRDQSGDNSNNFHPISVADGQYRGVDIFQRMGGSQDAQNVCIFHRKHKLKSALRTSP